MSIWGNPVTLGGSGGGIPTIPEQQWDAMTPEQKESYGLVGLTTTETGYFRGYLVNGSSLSRSLLDLSDAPFISTEEFWDTFIDGDTTWGNFEVHGSGISRDTTNECVLIDQNAWLTADVLGNADFTLYLLAKCLTSKSEVRTIAGVKRSDAERCGLYSYGTNTIRLYTSNSYYTSATSAPTSWRLYAVSMNTSTKKVGLDVYPSVHLNPHAFRSWSPFQLLSLGAYSDGSAWQKLAVKYCAVTQKLDSDQLIASNMQRIADYFGLGT